MPKMKTKKSVAKRFRCTARGKVLCRRPGSRHLLGSKSRKRKRHMRSPAVLTRVEARHVAAMIQG